MCQSWSDHFPETLNTERPNTAIQFGTQVKFCW